MKRRLIVPIFAAFLTAAPAAAQKPSEVLQVTAKAPATVKPGGTAAIRLDAEVSDGWYVYAMTQPENGPTPLAFTVPGGAGFALDKKRIAAPVAKIKQDPGFGTETQTYEGKATFTLPLTVARAVKPAAHTVPIEVTFQACNGSICLRPSTMVVPVVIAVRRSPIADR